MTGRSCRRFAWLTAFLISSAAGATAQEQVADTQFNFTRGFYWNSITFVIKSKTVGAKIRYTTDGSAPDTENGLGNANPVAVNISRTTVLRAIAYEEGMAPSNVDTQTYLFLDDVIRQGREIPGYPSPVLPVSRHSSVPLDYEMDPGIVNHPAYRKDLYSGLQSIPTLSIVLNREDLFGDNGVYYGSDGDGPTKPASAEFIYPKDPRRSLQVNCALESHATIAIKRSFKLKFKREYGPGKLITSFFQDSPLNGDSATDQLDRIVLRSGNEHCFAMNYYPDRTTYLRDQWARDSQIDMSGFGSHGTFVHLYLNGLYWGLSNAVERPDAWFTSATFGGDKEDWFAVNQRDPFQGDPVRWDYLRGDLKNKDLRQPANYQEIQEYLDVNQFADYLILAFMAGFADWPFNKLWHSFRSAFQIPTIRGKSSIR